MSFSEPVCVPNCVFFDTEDARRRLSPLSDTCPLAALRVGIFTIAQKWQRLISSRFSFLTAPYLSSVFPLKVAAQNLAINGAFCPNESLMCELVQLTPGQRLVHAESGQTIAALCNAAQLEGLFEHTPSSTSDLQTIFFEGVCTHLCHLWDIFLHNQQEIRSDFSSLCRPIDMAQRVPDKHTIIYSPEQVFVGKNVCMRAAYLNAEIGPIYIGDDVQIHEGAVLKGPLALGQGVQVMPRACIESSSIGPYSKVGGEVYGSVMQGYSNKAHDGFLGHSAIGKWCNLGGGTTTSNMRIDYREVKVWDRQLTRFDATPMIFCGTFMGDHSVCGAATLFNAGTTVGVGAALFGGGVFDKNVPAFAWVRSGRPVQTYRIERALEAMRAAMQRRSKAMSQAEEDILAHVFTSTAVQRIESVL